MMRAAVVDRYGSPEVVRVTEVPLPEPRPGEVRVRVDAVAVTSADARIRAAHFPRGFALPARAVFGLRRPRRPVLGSTFSGVVDATGDRVEGFAAGDAVCGMSGARLGAHAEYVVVDAEKVVGKPDAVSHEDAAGLLFGGSTARWLLHEKAPVAPGLCVLVNGASGAVGTNAVQLASLAGAHVTGVTSAPNAALVTELGAESVVDYRTTPLIDLDARFDVVLDAVGNLTIAAGRRLLAPGGTLVLAVADLSTTLRARGHVVTGSAPERAADFEHLLGLVAAGDLTVVREPTVPLDDIVAAHRRVDTGRKVGNVVVRL